MLLVKRFRRWTREALLKRALWKIIKRFQNSKHLNFALKMLNEVSPRIARSVFMDLFILDYRRSTLVNRFPLHQANSSETCYQSICILGGGSAGYLTALGLKTKLPHLRVTVIESSKIPVIGVGEATTPLMPYFLFKELGLDEIEFYKKVRPTWKLGIKFIWGKPGNYYFNYPFGPSRLTEAYVYGKDMNFSNLNSMAMSLDHSSVFRNSSRPAMAYAFHLDNKRFVKYLKETAADRGVEIADCEITDIELCDNGDQIEFLTSSTGRRFTSDLFIDCSGFRSLLLEKTLGSRFVDFSDSLYTDSAIISEIPNQSIIRPYTQAETMNNGWCWTIPFEEADHLGYVFASSFCSPEDAVAEMRTKYRGMGDYWTVKFRSGRHKDFWKGNVVAIGNSYAFVEPLESTALHMILEEISTFVENFPISRKDSKIKDLLNKKINDSWDFLRWFLAIHYRFNKRLSTPFWCHSRANADYTGIAELVELYKERGPLSNRHDAKLIAERFISNRNIFGLSGVDHLLLGQGIEPREWVTPLDSYEAWDIRVMTPFTKLTSFALPQREALAQMRPAAL